MKYKKAFTLIELLVVMAIISLLSALVLNSLASARMKANDTKIAQDLRQFRIAAELYYNDNHEYPVGYVGINNQSNNIAINNSWSHKLSFFVKTAEAAGHPNTPLCRNFDTMAESMVAKKYLSTVPVHPYDNDANGVCYKAVNATTTFSAYAALTTQVSVNGSAMNKRVGFILGDTSSTGLGILSSAIIDNKNMVNGVKESIFPTDATGATVLDLATAVDNIIDVTSGSNTSVSNSETFSTTKTYTLTVSNTNPSGGDFTVSDSGGVATLNGPITSTHNAGETIVITPYPAKFYGASVSGSTSFFENSFTVIMDSDKVITIYFYRGHN